MLTQSQFLILIAFQNNPQQTQRSLSDELGLSLGTINKTCKDLKDLELVDKDGVTCAGTRALLPYKVDNAIIMAAGMSSRFVPISLEKPKGLLEVKGEVLIERQIRQLQEVGISDITIVVGYLKEQFFYLEEKFGVTIVVNEDYYCYNNTSSLIRVTDSFKNTYLCSSDNYFTENVFEKFVYQSYYSAVFSENKTNEYCITTDKNGCITAVNIGGEQSWYMLGHAYFRKDFSEKFISILKEKYILPSTKALLWEDLYIQHISELDLFIKKYDSSVVYEFDSLEELRQFDPLYINNADSSILKNIAHYFKCSQYDIANIIPIKKGMTNISFYFEVYGKKYVYRHPGKGTELYINRKAEYQALHTAKDLGIDSTFLYMNEKDGWKISIYKENVRNLSYDSEEDTRQALHILKKLHDSKMMIEYDFDMWEKITDFLERVHKKGKTGFQDFQQIMVTMQKVHKFVALDNFPKIFCHCDSFDPNFMFHDGGVDLIDWEYAGNSDIGTDLGTFIVCNPKNSYAYAVRIIEEYYGKNISHEMLRHNIAYCALSSYYWFLWALYQESIGQSVGEYLHIWYKGIKVYAEKALTLYTLEKK